MAVKSFLFTDIEGSTRRWQAHGPAMRRALETHDALAAEVVTAKSGLVFKHTGDGICAVFPSTPAAVEAAAEIQRRLGRADFDDVGGLAVRMGVHTGEAEERDGDYFGTALNRTARLMSLAHGGQVLVSDAVAALLADAPAAGVELVDLGEHELRDIARPERVHQVVAEGLERDFPPLRGGSAPRHRLPEPRTTFVGRTDEVAALDKALERHRLVTLVGIGGTGKTRLAIEVAHRAALSFPSGAFFADLSPLTDGDLVAPTIAQAVGLPSADLGASATAALVEFLGGGRSLLVLDNCEQIVDACAEVVDTLLDACPELVLLATSREALGVEGEHSWPVHSLSVEGTAPGAASEAVELFVERAQATSSAFVLTPENLADVTEICRRLDGIPLAIELAASRVAHMSPAEIAARLDDRFRLLVGGAKRRSQRQQTLQAALDWSHDLLTEEERVMLRRLSVFAGGFTVDTAAEGSADGDSRRALELLASLVDKSLVVPEPRATGTRYRLLETVRIYAAQKLLDAGESAGCRRRQRDRLLAWLESFPLDDAVVTYPVVEAIGEELDNLRAALDWSEAEGEPSLALRIALPMTGAWAFNGFHQEGIGRLTALSDAELSDLERADCLTMVAFLAMYAGDFTMMHGSAQQALALAPEGRCSAMALTLQRLYTGFDPVERTALHADHDRARRLAHAAGMPRFAEGATAMEAHFFVEEGDYEAVAAITADVPTGPSYNTFVFELAALVAAIATERPDEALAHAEVVAELVWSTGYGGLFRGIALVETGRVEEARALLSASARQLLETPTPLGTGDALIGFAGLALAEGEPARAASLLETVWAQGGLAAYRSPASWVLSRRYRYRAKDALDPDTWEAARAAGRRVSATAALQGEVDRCR
jgi:predicted ATPase